VFGAMYIIQHSAQNGYLGHYLLPGNSVSLPGHFYYPVADPTVPLWLQIWCNFTTYITNFTYLHAS